MVENIRDDFLVILRFFIFDEDIEKFFLGFVLFLRSLKVILVLLWLIVLWIGV